MDQDLALSRARGLGPGVDLMADLRDYLGFTDEAYLAKNADVAEAGADPFAHFVQYGRYERHRDFGFHTRETWAQSAGFDRDLYAARYPDVVAAGFDPLAHFLQFGFWEGRLKSLVPATAVWEQLKIEPAAWTLRDVTSGGGCPDLDGVGTDRIRSTLGVFLRRGPRGLHKSDAAIFLGWLALLVGESAIAEAFFETHQLGPPYFWKPSETAVRSVAAFPARSLRDFSAERGLATTVVVRSQPVSVPSYTVVRRCGATRTQPKTRQSDEVVGVRLPDATAFPGEDYVLSEGTIVMVGDVAGGGSGGGLGGHGPLAVGGGFAVVEWPAAASLGEPLPSAVSFLGSNAHDLADHLFTKSASLPLLGDDEPRVVLVESTLPPHYTEWAQSIAPGASFVAATQPIRVRHLQLLFRSGASGLPSPSAVSWTKTHAVDARAKADGSRLFLVNGFSRAPGLINRNSAVLADYLKSFNFRTLDPARASAQEALALIGKASVIIAELGPALALCVACRPGTQIVVLCHEASGASYDSLAFLAASARCQIVFYQGLELKRSARETWRHDYLIDVADLAECIRTTIA